MRGESTYSNSSKVIETEFEGRWGEKHGPRSATNDASMKSVAVRQKLLLVSLMRRA
jgi:hypothetical protein